MSAPFKPGDPCRWAVLGLADPDPRLYFPEGATTADLLAWAAMSPGAADPIEGLVNSVRVDLEALAELHEAYKPAVHDLLSALVRRLNVVVTLLRRADGREKTPPGEPPEESPDDLADHLDDPDVTQDRAPSSGEVPS